MENFIFRFGQILPVIDKIAFDLWIIVHASQESDNWNHLTTLFDDFPHVSEQLAEGLKSICENMDINTATDELVQIDSNLTASMITNYALSLSTNQFPNVSGLLDTHIGQHVPNSSLVQNLGPPHQTSGMPNVIKFIKWFNFFRDNFLVFVALRHNNLPWRSSMATFYSQYVCFKTTARAFFLTCFDWQVAHAPAQSTPCL